MVSYYLKISWSHHIEEDKWRNVGYVDLLFLVALPSSPCKLLSIQESETKRTLQFVQACIRELGWRNVAEEASVAISKYKRHDGTHGRTLWIQNQRREEQGELMEANMREEKANARGSTTAQS